MKNSIKRLINTIAIFGIMACIINNAQAQGDKNWGEWRSFTSSKAHDIEYRIGCETGSLSDGKTTWWVEFRNNGSQTVRFDFKLTGKNESKPDATEFSDGINIKPNATQAGWEKVSTPCGSGSEVKVWLANIKYND